MIMKPVTQSMFLEDLFETSRETFGADLAAYRNHVYRVLSFARALAPAAADCERKLEIACYFHDLGIWADETFDYLGPSVARARVYLDSCGLADWGEEISHMIGEHHKITSAAAYGPLVEAFRRADWIDVSLGIVRYGLPRSFIAQVRHTLPNCGFHRRLVELAVERACKHPLSPLPMFKW